MKIERAQCRLGDARGGSALIVAIVMMVIGNNLARAFALVGALSIIRFRTVIKDTKDTAYVFLALAGGMAAGTSSYFLAITGVVFVCIGKQGSDTWGVDRSCANGSVDLARH